MPDFKTGPAESAAPDTRIIYRCRRCKATLRIDYETSVRREFYVARDHATGYERQGVRTQHWFRLADGTVTAWLPAKDCPRCGRLMERKSIVGTLNPSIPCNPKCMGATGPVCECSCGGENHGGRWIAIAPARRG